MLKRLLNLPESVTDKRLREVCDDFDAKVYAKARVADVLPIEHSGINDKHYKYALQAHFDFVVADSEDQPLLAIEFDGPSHYEPDAQKRDEMKNTLCDKFELPLLRVNHNYLNNSFSNWDLLRWFCTVFFVNREWEEDVKAGRIPIEDLIFDPMFVSVKTKSGTRSLELERYARGELGRLFISREIPFPVPNCITGEGEDRTLRAISWIETADQKCVITETAMRYHNLGSWVQFAIRGIVLTELVNCVHAAVTGKKPALPIASINIRVKDFEGRFKTIMSFRRG